MAKDFNIRKFLTENRLTPNSMEVNETGEPQDIQWEKDGTVNSYGTHDPDEMDEVEYEMVGCSEETGKCYLATAFGSYGEIDDSSVQIVRELDPEEEQHYRKSLERSR